MSFWLFVLLAMLKLFEVIDWSWWWVTAPLWYMPFLFLWLAISLGIGEAFQKVFGRSKGGD